MKEVVEFLRARLDEDEREAKVCLDQWARGEGGTSRRWQTVLREVEAKRRIVELQWHHLGEADYAWGMEEAKRQVLMIMASIYADHPDYREEWR